MKSIKRFFYVIIFAIMSIPTFSEIKIGVDNSNPAVKQHIAFVVDFAGESKSEYVVEGMEKFNIVSMVSRSNYTSVNKKVNYSKSDVYTICPKEEGKATLKVIAKNGSESNEIVVNISKEIPQKEQDKKFVLELTPYNRDYYLGEKIPFTEKLRINASVNNYSYILTPTFNGFSMKSVTPRDNRGFPIPRRITIDGKEQIEVVLFRSILEPVSTGKKNIRTGGIRLIEDKGENAPADNVTLKEDNQVPVYLGYKELEINILPLPEENKPKNFQEVVGDLKGKYNWETYTNEGKKIAVLHLELYGNVNLDKLEKIILDEEIRKKYNIKENILSYEEHVLNNIYRAEKSYEIIFVLEKDSLENLDNFQIKIPYFNPIEKTYKEYTVSYEKNKDKMGDNKEKEIFYLEHEQEVSFISDNQIEKGDFFATKNSNLNSKTDALSSLSETTENNLDTKNKTKDMVIAILSVVALAEAIYIFINRKNKK